MTFFLFREKIARYIHTPVRRGGEYAVSVTRGVKSEKELRTPLRGTRHVLLRNTVSNMSRRYPISRGRGSNTVIASVYQALRAAWGVLGRNRAPSERKCRPLCRCRGNHCGAAGRGASCCPVQGCPQSRRCSCEHESCTHITIAGLT